MQFSSQDGMRAAAMWSLGSIFLATAKEGKQIAITHASNEAMFVSDQINWLHVFFSESMTKARRIV